MKTKLGVLLSVALVVAVGGLLAEDAKDAVDFSKIKCVVSGKAVNPDATLAYKEAKVYFCCTNCPKAFEQDTKKFATKANHQLVATRQAKQVACPLSGKELDETTTIEVSGTKIAFCCNNCKGAVEKKTGNDQLEMAFSDKAFEKAFKVVKAEEKQAK